MTLTIEPYPKRRGKLHVKGTQKPRSAKKKRKTTKSTPPKYWPLRKADREFSLEVRNRDKKCLFPGCTETDIKKLQCSHFIGRARAITRFSLDNCISLCWKHHYGDKLIGFEYQKQLEWKHGYDGQYTKFMQNWLGKEKFSLLMIAELTIIKRNKAIEELMRRHGALITLER